VSAPGLRHAALAGDDPVDPAVEQVGDPGDRQHVERVRAGGDDRGSQARLRTART
jgi:hypothetical protein